MNAEPPFEIVGRQHGRPARLAIRCKDSHHWLCLTLREFESQMRFRQTLRDAVAYSDPPIPCPDALREPVSEEQWDAWFKKALGDFKEKEQSQ
ncbi:hypothetical protein AUC71_15035 [Methyloceanibacter marginalis]|uniref:Uncharacterized protein n=2 Tax=Methyloceanibacter marginalis TaxID=1774971 RepID=A0A1E3W9K0_9HYPH|nr:hypothetical protein AUC71_15035 [Methyloceanibacter marginalis]